jgi:hypothetical protein
MSLDILGWTIIALSGVAFLAVIAMVIVLMRSQDQGGNDD